ncbi:hypothetical protein CSA56_15650 [candidate division KSB3 bacterium]|uniref:Uncharacterized protein n=1 Tax=candidate division KSB3 bacterium TaxID=2044937 RepID=A0A2G6K9V4_9BACT|nr:MAG: hypothetical protein CSA56_15650 [candidate division KSB3 bacterium]
MILDSAKADLQGFLDSLAVEETAELKQIVSHLDRVLRDVRRGPPQLEENLKKIADDLTKIHPSK